MGRGLVARGLFAGVLALATPRLATADKIDEQVETLEGRGGYKARLAAALALSKATDDRAVIALAAALGNDRESSVRKVAALALKQMVTGATGSGARSKAVAALERASAKDKDKKVRAAAARALTTIQELLASKAPRVFVNIDQPKDKTKKAPSRAVSELDKAVRAEVKRASKDYSVDWPGSLPTAAELDRLGTRAFIVAASVAKLTIAKNGKKAEVSCTVEVRVAPWEGTDGEERWVANQTGKATGSGKASTGSSDAQIANGMVDCVAAVGEQLTADKVVPFIKGLAKQK